MSHYSTYIDIEKAGTGEGLFAAVAIPAGTVLLKVTGEPASFEETLQDKEKESYFLQVGMREYMNPDFPFYLSNHSCNPNCGINQQMEFFTLGDIEAGEELRWDYSTSMNEHHWSIKCKCGAANCRGVIADFATLPKASQNRYYEMGIVLPYIVALIEAGEI